MGVKQKRKLQWVSPGCAYCLWKAEVGEHNLWWYAGTPRQFAVVSCADPACQEKANAHCNRLDFGDSLLADLVVRRPMIGQTRKKRGGGRRRPLADAVEGAG